MTPSHRATAERSQGFHRRGCAVPQELDHVVGLVIGSANREERKMRETERGFSLCIHRASDRVRGRQMFLEERLLGGAVRSNRDGDGWIRHACNLDDTARPKGLGCRDYNESRVPNPGALEYICPRCVSLDGVFAAPPPA